MNAQEFAQQIGAFRRSVAGIVRKMAIRITSGGSWQVAGHSLFDPTKRESPEPPVFSGVGFYSRPPAGSASAEAVVVQIGGANNPAIVATRDEATRSASAGDLEADESCVFNSLVRVRVRANGTIEISTVAGAVQPTLRGTSYRAAEDTMLSAIQALLTALATSAPPLGTAPQQAATATAATAAASAIGTFQGGAAGYLTTVARVE